MQVGIDVLEVERIKTTQSFLTKILTENEINYITKFKNSKERIAGFFCAKEAVFKAIAGDVFRPKEIEINHEENGRPYVVLKGKTSKHFEKFFKEIDISISHSKTIAEAICIVN